MDRAEVGRRGEAVAARFYQKQGCLLVAHNYSLLVGEIEMCIRDRLYTVRALHLPLSLAIFTLLLPEQEAEVFSTLDVYKRQVRHHPGCGLHL